ncbi:MAG: 5'-nucleotidase C-terminal domain-containing protein [Candidatus Gastranaerophilaceae bacterium]
MNISHLNLKNITTKVVSTSKDTVKEAKTEQTDIKHFSSHVNNAALAYGKASIAINKTTPVADKKEKTSPQQKTINLFYFSDTHGELTGLTKLGSAKEACEIYCGGKENLTVLGSGDLIAGSQMSVINATVNVVNQMDMQATAMGNHERGRSDAKLVQLAENLKPELLAINASEKDKNCSVTASKICKQGDMEFITIGAKPLSPIEDAKDIAIAIDQEVSRIKEERRNQDLNDNLPVVFLSHMGSKADKTVAENSESINLILGGHSHNVEEFNYTSKNGNNVLVLQAGKNNALATIVKMDIAPDGTVSASAQKINLKQDTAEICKQVGSFYGQTELDSKILESVQSAEQEIAKTVSENVGPKNDLAYVPEGQGYNLYEDGYEADRERHYSNPVSNIMADAMLTATADKGVQVSFFNAPAVKDTMIPDNQNISNYDIMGRMLPFGGNVVTAEIPIDKLYEVLEQRAQTIVSYEGSQLMQVGGMTYSVNAEKAKARYDASLTIAKAEKNLSDAKTRGIDTSSAAAALEKAKTDYDNLPGCIEKILILNEDGSELKINPKAIARGDFDGMTIKCATNDFLAHEAGIDKEEYGFENTGKELTKVFEQGIEEVRKNNDGVMYVDQNDVRISIKDKEGIVNGYEVPTGINSKYWY